MTEAVRILLIDDNDSFRKMVCRMLVAAGYDVQEAGNGKTGLARYRQQRVDVVVTDIVMPDMEGLETIVKLRREDPHVKIIAMSGADEKDGAYLQSALLFGARRTLQKPFTKDELLTAVTEVLAT
jgi:CheY-like chemotaxis protein